MHEKQLRIERGLMSHGEKIFRLAVDVGRFCQFFSAKVDFRNRFSPAFSCGWVQPQISPTVDSARCENGSCKTNKSSLMSTYASTWPASLTTRIASWSATHDFVQQNFISTVDFTNSLVWERQTHPCSVFVTEKTRTWISRQHKTQFSLLPFRFWKRNLV